MKKAKRIVNNFTNYLFETYKVPRIPVHVHWGYDTVATENGVGFGVFMQDKDGGNQCIHVGAGKLGKGIAMRTIAHEFTHYVQQLKGRGWDDIPALEDDAEYWADALYHQECINKKSKTIRVDGVGEIGKEANAE